MFCLYYIMGMEGEPMTLEEYKEWSLRCCKAERIRNKIAKAGEVLRAMNPNNEVVVNVNGNYFSDEGPVAIGMMTEYLKQRMAKLKKELEKF